MSRHVELTTRAVKDLRRLDRSVRERIARVLRERLAAERRPPNLDIVQLEGRAPWCRLRVGDYRVIFRPLSVAELRTIGSEDRTGVLVERIVHRRDLERSTGGL